MLTVARGRVQIACGWPMLVTRNVDDTWRDWFHTRARMISDWMCFDCTRAEDWTLYQFGGIVVWIWK